MSPADAFEPTRRISPDATPSSDAAIDPMIGRQVIGQYLIEKKLGVGGMGAVYLAQQTTVSRPAVIKVLRSQLGGSADGIERFAVEAKAASSLNHPNIVTIYNYGEMPDGTLFLAMEYIAGETLAQRLERCGQLPVDRAVHIAAQIASALGEAHTHGVVHRDLKPQNVMLVERAGEPDFVKVLDFGIAKLDDTSVTSTGYVVGTPRYMSPEQLLGKRLDGRSDIYAAAILLYEMLTGVTPFQSDTPIGWMHQHVDVQPRPPSTLTKAGKISELVDRVVLRALAKAPTDRPSSMEMFARDLVAALNAPTDPPPPRWWRRAAVHMARLTALFVLATSSGTWDVLRTIGTSAQRSVRALRSGAWRVLCAIGVGTVRALRAIRSGTRKTLQARRNAARRSTSPRTPTMQRAVPAERARTPLASLSIGRRLLIALLVIVACAALLVALFPQVRADFGLASTEKPEVDTPKRSQPPLPARERARDKAR